MGRIKTQLIKRATNNLMKEYGDKFTDDFNQNKKIVSEYVVISSKKLKNIIAGYATRLVKRKKDDFSL